MVGKVGVSPFGFGCTFAEHLGSYRNLFAILGLTGQLAFGLFPQSSWQSGVGDWDDGSVLSITRNVPSCAGFSDAEVMTLAMRSDGRRPRNLHNAQLQSLAYSEAFRQPATSLVSAPQAAATMAAVRMADCMSSYRALCRAYRQG